MFCVCEQCTSRRSLFLTAGGRGYARSSAPWLRWGAVCQQLNTQHHGGFYFGDTQRLHWTAVLLLLLQSHQPASAAASAPFNFFSRTPAAHISSMRCVPWSGLTQHQPQLVSPLPSSSHSPRRESSAVQHPRIAQRPASTATRAARGTASSAGATAQWARRSCRRTLCLAVGETFILLTPPFHPY